MAFTLYSLMQAALLCLNAIAIVVLHKEWNASSRTLAGEQTRELVDSERSQELNLN